MANSLKLDGERSLSWTVEVPPVHYRRVIRSPDFWLQNCESFFLLLQCDGYSDYSNYDFRFYLSIEEGQRVKISSYDPKETSHRFEVDVITTSGFIGGVHRFPDKRSEEKKFCFIFNCPIRLNKECKEKDLSGLGLEKLSNDFSNLLMDDSLHDVKLKCGNVTIKAHKAVLSCRSKVFSAMFQSNMEEVLNGHVDIEGMNAAVFKIFIRYLYTGKLQELTSVNAKRLYEAGDMYEVEDLMKRCAIFLIKHLSPENACHKLALADAHSDEQSKRIIIQYMLDENIPLRGDLWEAFCESHSQLALEVLNQFYKSQKE